MNYKVGFSFQYLTSGSGCFVDLCKFSSTSPDQRLPIKQVHHVSQTALWQNLKSSGHCYRRNVPSQRTENGRRKKIVELMTSLLNQRRWGVASALRFLWDMYEPTHKPHAFADYLAKHRDAIITCTASYP